MRRAGVPRELSESGVGSKSFSFATFGLISLVFLLVRLVELPDVLDSFFGALFYYLLPYSFGHIVLVSASLSRFAMTGIPLVTGWMWGTVLLFILSIVLNSLGIFSLAALYIVYCVFFSFYFLKVRRNQSVYRLDLAAYVVPVLFGVVSYFLIRLRSPFPFAPDWDGFVFSFVANRIHLYNEFHILQQTYSETLFLVAEINRPHNLLLALSSFVTSSEPFEVNWWAVLYNYIGYFLAMDLLMKKLFRKSMSYRFILSVAILFVEYHLPGALILFSPATTVSILTIFNLLIYLEDETGPDWGRLIIGIASFLVFYLIWHYTIGIFYFTFALACLVGVSTIRKTADRREPHSELVKTSLVVLFLVLALGSIVSLNTELNIHLDFMSTLADSLGLPTTTFRSAQKIYRLSIYYSLPVVYISLIASTAFLYLFKTNDDPRQHQIFILNFCFASLLLIYCAITAPFIHRIIYLFKIFIPISMGTLVFYFKDMRFQMHYSGYSFQLDGSKISILTLLIIVAFASFPNYANFMDTYSAMGDDELFSSYTEYDLRMGLWIRHKVERGYLIVGEPEDQNIVSGLSGLDNLGAHYMDASDTDMLRSFLKSSNESESIVILKEIMQKHNKTEALVILSGRTTYWLEKKVPIVYHPRSFKMSETYRKFFDSDTFTLIHCEDEEIYAFVMED